jgi:hypothetical protein
MGVARKGAAPTKEPIMKTRTHIRAGGRRVNHNETLVPDAAAPRRLRVRTGITAGGRRINHNETLSRDVRPATTRNVFRVRTAVPAGVSGVRR